MNHTSPRSTGQLPAAPENTRNGIRDIDDDDVQVQDPNEKSPSSPRPSRAPAESFQFNMPEPFTGLWRLYSDQIARESVQSANSNQVVLPAAAAATTTVNKLPAALDPKRSVRLKSNGSFEEESPAVPLYGTPAKSPLIDEDDEKDDVDVIPPTNGVHHPMQRLTTGSQRNVQQSMPEPLTGLWRKFSDMIARENMEDTNEKEPPPLQVKTAPQAEKTATASPTSGKTRRSSSDATPGIVDTTFDEESVDERSIHALPDDSRFLNDDEIRSYDSPTWLFHYALDQDEEQRESTTSRSTPYLDPDLVRRAHRHARIPSDLPRMISFPSDDSLKDAPHHVSIHGDKKEVKMGMVELHPGEFVRVHGKRHAQSAINKGQSIVVKCSTCRTKYQVDRRAGSLYCTKCDSVTRIHKNQAVRMVHSI